MPRNPFSSFLRHGIRAPQPQHEGESQGFDPGRDEAPSAEVSIAGRSPEARPEEYGAALNGARGNGAMQMGLLRGLQRGYGNGYVGGVIGAGESLAGQIAERSGGGMPLDSGAQAELEEGLGADMGGVRVHNDAASDAIAADANAEAVTHGQDIFFRSGRYDPSSPEGRDLLRHEAAHTVQQRGGEGGMKMGEPGGGHEGEAEQAAGAMGAGEKALGMQGNAPGVQRDPSPQGAGAQEQKSSDPERDALLGVDMHALPGTEFDAAYQPRGGKGLTTITTRIYFNFLDAKQDWIDEHKFNFENFVGLERARNQFYWNDESRVKFKNNFMRDVHDGWSGKHTLRCARAGLEDITSQVEVNIEAVDDPSKAHATVQAQKVPDFFDIAEDYDAASQTFPQKHEMRMSSQDEDPSTKSTQLQLFGTQVGPFAEGEDSVGQNLFANLEAVAAALKAIPGGLHDKVVTIRGWAYDSGADYTDRKTVAFNRATAVADFLKSRGVQLSQMFAGFEGAGNTKFEHSVADTPTADNRRVDIEVRTKDPVELQQNVAAHEAGHLIFGLGDEYPDSTLNRLPGTKPTHYNDVERELGTKEAEEGRVASRDTIMSMGMVVRPGHYVRVIQVMEAMTGVQWTI